MAQRKTADTEGEYTHAWRRLLWALKLSPASIITKNGTRYLMNGVRWQRDTIEKLERDGFIETFPGFPHAWHLTAAGKMEIARMRGPGKMRRSRKAAPAEVNGDGASNGHARPVDRAPFTSAPIMAPASRPVQPVLVTDRPASQRMRDDAGMVALIDAVQTLAAAVKQQTLTLNRIDVTLTTMQADTRSMRILLGSSGGKIHELERELEQGFESVRETVFACNGVNGPMVGAVNRTTAMVARLVRAWEGENGDGDK